MKPTATTTNVRWLVPDELKKVKPNARFKEGINLNELVKLQRDGNRTIAEFVGTGDFASDFITRQRYEVDAGRLEVPTLYQTIYTPVVDPNLPKTVEVDVLGPGGVVVQEITEGGEVVFMTVGEGSKSISIKHYGVGLEYSEDLFLYNQTWRFAPLERWVGRAFNALFNHVHLYPIISASYDTDNQTAASSTGSTLEEKILSTLEDAVTNSMSDATNPRYGPYDLIIAAADMFTVSRALMWRLQSGLDYQSPVVGYIQNVIVYPGYTLTRGKKSTTYTGVTSGTAYLVSKAHADMDFKSLWKHDVRRQAGEKDTSRFILEQEIYDARFGVYANPTAAVEEITWPSS